MKAPVFSLSSKYNTIALVVGGGLLLAILIGVFLMQPAWSRLQQLGLEIPVEQQKRDQAKQDFDNLSDAKQFFEGNTDAVQSVNTALPIQPDVPGILVILEQLAVDTGVFLDGFTPQQLGGEGAGTGGAPPGAAPTTSAQAGGTAAPAGVQSIEITANFSGRYDSLINFFYSLERSLRIVDVKIVNVNAVKGQADPVITGNISFLTYYKNVPGAPKGGARQTTGGSGSAAASPAPVGGGQ